MSKDVLITQSRVSSSNSKFFNHIYVFCSENEDAVEIAHENKEKMERFEQKIREVLEGDNVELSEFSLYYFKTKTGCAKERHELKNEFALRNSEGLYFCIEHLESAFRNR